MSNKILLFFLLIICTGKLWASCPERSEYQGSANWSQRKTFVSPNHLWMVQTDPKIDSKNDLSPVYLKKCVGGYLREIFNLDRDAEFYWSKSSQYIFIINEPLSGENEVKIFSAVEKPEKIIENERLINYKINKKIQNIIGNDKKIIFYLPSFLKWDGDKVLLAIGGQNLPSGQKYGSMDEYCYGMKIDIKSQEIIKIYSASQLKIKYHKDCLTSP